MKKQTHTPKSKVAKRFGIWLVLAGVVATIFLMLDSNKDQSDIPTFTPPPSSNPPAPMFRTSPNPPLDSVAAQKKRRELRTRFELLLGKIQEIAKRTNHPTVITLENFLRTKTQMCVPISHQGYDGVFSLEQDESQKWIGFVWVSEKDSLPSESWKRAASPKELSARYDPGMQSIIMADLKMNPLQTAFILMHEAFHAWTDYTNPYEHTREAVNLEEVETHMFEQEVLSLWGGKAYEEVLQAEIQRIADSTETYGDKMGDFYSVSIPEYDKRLDAIFGRALSPPDKSSRSVHVNLHANFRIADTYLSRDKAFQKKLEIISRIYGGVTY